MSEVTITVSGRVGSGKSALCGEIEILCKALGIQVEWIDGQQEKNLTHADWTEALEMYKPRVKIIEEIARAAAPQSALTDEQIIEIWTGDPTHSRPVIGKNKVIAFARALIDQAPTERMSDAEESSIRALYEDACIQANKNAEDAARYRWLKMRSSIPDQQRIMLSTPWGQWDAVIDAARKAKIERGEGQS